MEFLARLVLRTVRDRFVAFVQLTSICLSLLSNDALAQARQNKDYCQSDARIVILLVDVTTPYDQTDKNVIIRLTDQVLSLAKGGEKLVIRTIADSHTHSERLIDRCIPYCAAVGTLDRLFNCSDGLIRTDLENVRAEVVNSLRQRLSKFEELRYSDIVRTIFSVSKEDVVQGRPLTLYVYSDLIENSDYFPGRYLFSNPPRRLLNDLKQKHKLIASLKDAEVHISGVGRAGTKDRRALTVAELQKLTEFWKAYFEESGAKLVTIGQDTIESPR